MFKILIVEDTAVELELAVKIAKEMGFVVETNMCGKAMYQLSSYQDGEFVPNYDGVVTDIFMPFEEGASDQPCGVGVALKAKELLIPTVFCTSEYHHSSKGQWIASCSDIIGAPYLDKNGDYYIDAPPPEEKGHKPWRPALKRLKYMIEKKNS